MNLRIVVGNRSRCGRRSDRDLYKDDGRRYPSDLTDAQWALSSYDALKVDVRDMVNACLYLEKTGCPWHYLPSDFGPGGRCAPGTTGSTPMGSGRRSQPC
jgi:Putative transposase of IS4/5 family (DUF4096)